MKSVPYAKYDDMGPGPQPAAPAGEKNNGHASFADARGAADAGLERRRAEPVQPGIVHPDIIEAAIRMLADQGYRVFRAKDVRSIEASYAIRPAMLHEPEFEQLIRGRVLQELSINAATHPAVRVTAVDGHYGRLITAKVLVVMPWETEV